ncbi:MAG: 6-phosphofructokinase [Pseudomonadota bacterium]|nr:6-phosphofructokinase [Pseudomonadota bacterium]
MKGNIFYAQSGGVTPVINATASGLIEHFFKNKKYFGRFYAGKNGILGALNEELIDIASENKLELKLLSKTPGGAFGSCRLKLKDYVKSEREFQRIYEVFKAHNIRYFFYNGGGDSQDTTNKISKFFKIKGYAISCIGLPKTIDNDLPITYCCPGYGSVAKYIATSTLEASLDVKSMSQTSTKVFILEVMGRHAGWLAASSGIIKTKAEEPPHIILFPEVEFKQTDFLRKVRDVINKYGYCVIVASEGIKSKKKFISDSGLKDSFGHAQLGGVAPVLSNMITSKLNIKVHWAVSDYLQRSARHIGSRVDVEQAYMLGKSGIDYAKKNITDVMLTIIRVNNKSRFQWKVSHTPLDNVANQEKMLPRNFIKSNGYEISKSCMSYITDLTQGEDYPSYVNGFPRYANLNCKTIKKKLKKFNL